jgi:hypothetical protein
MYDQTNYDDVYLPVNAMTEYHELKKLLDRWIEALNEADKRGFNTRTPRIKIDHIMYKMEHIVMPILKIQAKPWEKLGISETTYYNRRKG